MADLEQKQLPCSLMQVDYGIEWQKRGEMYVLRSNCCIGDKIFPVIKARLGEVRKKNDGRWEWTVRPEEYAKPIWSVEKVQQGVRMTLEEAKAKVEGFLRTPIPGK